MPSYLSLVQWTDRGIGDVKASPERLEAAKQLIQAEGGRMILFYMVMGEYDIATLMELPSDDAAARVALRLGAAGSLRTTTTRAFTEDETRPSSLRCRSGDMSYNRASHPRSVSNSAASRPT